MAVSVVAIHCLGCAADQVVLLLESEAALEVRLVDLPRKAMPVALVPLLEYEDVPEALLLEYEDVRAAFLLGYEEDRAALPPG